MLAQIPQVPDSRPRRQRKRQRPSSDDEFDSNSDDYEVPGGPIDIDSDEASGQAPPNQTLDIGEEVDEKVERQWLNAVDTFEVSIY